MITGSLKAQHDRRGENVIIAPPRPPPTNPPSKKREHNRYKKNASRWNSWKEKTLHWKKNKEKHEAQKTAWKKQHFRDINKSENRAHARASENKTDAFSTIAKHCATARGTQIEHAVQWRKNTHNAQPWTTKKNINNHTYIKKRENPARLPPKMKWRFLQPSQNTAPATQNARAQNHWWPQVTRFACTKCKFWKWHMTILAMARHWVFAGTYIYIYICVCVCVCLCVCLFVCVRMHKYNF